MIALVGAAMLSACSVAPIRPGLGPEHELVNQAVISLAAFSPEDFPSLAPSLRTACGVLIFPHVGTAGFLVGAAHGQGILMVRDSTDNRWHGPAFVSLSEVDIGAQVAGGAREFIAVMRTCAPLTSLYGQTASIHFGALLADQAGEHGSVRQVSKDVEVFSRMRGVDVGGALNGTMLRLNGEFGQAFYGAPLNVEEIMAEDPSADPIAVEIRRALAYAAK